MSRVNHWSFLHGSIVHLGQSMRNDHYLELNRGTHLGTDKRHHMLKRLSTDAKCNIACRNQHTPFTCCAMHEIITLYVK